MYPVTYFSNYGAIVGRQADLTWEVLKSQFTRPVVRRTKAGRTISPARFSTTRKNSEVVEFSLVIGDIDGFHEVEEIQERFASLGIRALIHTTFSHTPDNPKRRVIVPLEKPAPPKYHLTLWKILNGWCGETLDRACKDPARMFLLPVVPNLDAYQNFKALIVEGSDWDWSDVQLPPTQVERPSFRKIEPSRHFLSDVEKARHLMCLLSPTRAEHYLDWVRVGLALHQLGESGFHLWDEWSRISPKYREGETLKKWRSFNGSKLGLHSLMYWAKEDSGQEIRFHKNAA